jgi:hypothetical protein
MGKLKLFGKKVSFVLAIAGAAVVGGATTALVTAAIPASSDGQVHGCYRNSGNILNPKGSLRVIDNENSEACSASETSLNWGAKDVVKAYGNIKLIQDSYNNTTVELQPNSWNVNEAYLSNTYPGLGVCIDLSASVVNPMQVIMNGTADQNVTGADLSQENVDANCQSESDVFIVANSNFGEGEITEYLRVY